MNSDIFKSPEQIEIDFFGEKLKVVAYINEETQNKLLESYVSAFFSQPIEYRWQYAYNVLMLNILRFCTDFDFDFNGENTEYLKLIDGLKSSGLWDMITKNISNYSDIYYALETAVMDKRSAENSLESTVGNFLNKIVSVIEDFGNKEISEETIKNIKDASEALRKTAGIFPEESKKKRVKRA